MRLFALHESLCLKPCRCSRMGMRTHNPVRVAGVRDIQVVMCWEISVLDAPQHACDVPDSVIISSGTVLKVLSNIPESLPQWHPR